MTAAALAVGDELLIGQVRDTNSLWLSRQLEALGVRLGTSMITGDDQQSIEAGLEHCLANHHLVTVTGGLGPTPDDRTRDAAAAWAGVPLVTSDSVLMQVRERFARLKRDIPSGSHRVAQVPHGFEILPNPAGTAPGLIHRPAPDRMLILLPGVPHEMRAIYTAHAAAHIRELPGRKPVAHQTIRAVGVGETTVERRLSELPVQFGEDLQLAYLPNLGGVRLRITAVGADAPARAERAAHQIRDHLGVLAIGANAESLEEEVGQLLRRRNLTLATAESCTGGMIMHRLTNVPGASDYCMGAIVAYSNEVKCDRLGIRPRLLAAHGAVSESVAMQMAANVRQELSADLGLSVTGVAGPGGGTAAKPVGTVWIGYADKSRTIARQYHFGLNRVRNKERCVAAALDLARRMILGV